MVAAHVLLTDRVIPNFPVCQFYVFLPTRQVITTFPVCEVIIVCFPKKTDIIILIFLYAFEETTIKIIFHLEALVENGPFIPVYNTLVWSLNRD